ncbi:ATP-binding cassette domain-containing protein [Streptomyces calidiresistens]|uniref:ATP-binding cassette domain-containing protein n=1 Tax=Streptomyces calidiresistens TaxID=1485586 RepID=A0A7W3XYB6_9ACTN|nr:ATP-binding cassette domain-containing protein [Streptomyces calidiresistens]MBB0231667.1 ATP-binding cassette domain-containing protein [Streptomyces calidiresistens]
MITFSEVSVLHDGADHPVLDGLDLTVPEGELTLLVGPSGAGKTTLLGTVSGLVPHFTGGTLRGRVTVAGRDTRTHRPRDLADLVGSVGQDPLAHFVTGTVEEELAYGMESLGFPPATMRRRVEETLDLLGLEEVRDRPLETLSGGQQQRVAIGSVLTVHPSVLVLDEPTSALDPGAAEEVLAVLQRLVHDLGTTVLMAEHRLERVVQYADRLLLLPGDGRPAELGEPAALMARSPVRPPVVELAEVAGWSPPPLSVRAARRLAGPLRERLTAAGAAARPSATRETVGPPLATVRRLSVRRGRREVLRGAELTVRGGEVIALMGRNGSGKSTLLGSLVGLHPPAGGGILVGTGAGDPDLEPHRARPAEVLRRVGLVPQDPRHLLYAETVAAECATADADAGAPDGTCRGLLSRLLPGIADDSHPRDLSEGQRLALALAVVLAARPPLVLLDEPTRGLDHAAKARLVEIVRELAAEGHAVVLATHDVESAAEAADRVVVLAGGEVVADGPTAEVVVASPTFSPQVAKVLGAVGPLTPAGVRAVLSGEAGAPTGPTGPTGPTDVRAGSDPGVPADAGPASGAPATGAPGLEGAGGHGPRWWRRRRRTRTAREHRGAGPAGGGS